MKLEKDRYGRFFLGKKIDWESLTVQDLRDALKEGASVNETISHYRGSNDTLLSSMVRLGTSPDVIIEMIRNGADITTDAVNYEVLSEEVQNAVKFDIYEGVYGQVNWDTGMPTIEGNLKIPTFGLAFQRPTLMKALVKEIPTDVLRAALQYNKPDWVLPAIEAGADVNTTIKFDKEEKPLLTYAAEHTDPQTLKYLMAAGAKIPTDENSPLLAAWNGGNKENMDYLSQNGMDFKPLIDGMFKMFLSEIGHNLEEKALAVLKDKLQFAIDQGMDINQKDPAGYTALHTAILHNQPEVVELLLKNKADTTVLTPKGEPLLIYALKQRYSKPIEVLLNHGENPNQVFDGKSLLELAKEKSYNRDEDEKIIKVLEDHGAVEMPTTDFSGLTRERRGELFKEEMQKSKYNIFKLEALLKDGIYFDTHITSSSLLSKAIQYEKYDVLELLLKHKANPNETGKYSTSHYETGDKEKPILLFAVEQKKPKAVELLLKYGADANQMVDGESILELAHQKNDGWSEGRETIKVLEKHGAKMCPSLDFTGLTEERRSELFSEECTKKDYNEDKLMALIEQGIDIHHRVYGSGGQRMDDGQCWSWVTRLFKRGMRTNNPKIVQALLDQPGVESELYSGHQCCHWGYNNAAWLYDIFDNLYNMDPSEYDKVLPVILASPKMTDSELLRKGFEYLDQAAAEKLLRDETLEPNKLRALLRAKTFTIKTKEDLALLPKLKQAKAVGISFESLSGEDIDSVLSELASSTSLERVEVVGLKRVDKSQEKDVRDKLADKVRDALYPDRTLLEKAMGRHTQDSKKARRLVEKFHKEEADFPRKTALKIEGRAPVVQVEGERELVQKLAVLPVDSFSAKDTDGKRVNIEPLVKKARQDMEAAKHAGQEPWQVDIYRNLSTKNYGTAAAIMEKQGVFKQRAQKGDWGVEAFEIQKDSIGLDMRDLGNGIIAIGQIYDAGHIYRNGVGWNWAAKVALVNLEKGVGPQSNTGNLCVRDPNYCENDIFGNIPREDFLSVNGNRVSVRMGMYASTSVYIPESDDPKIKRKQVKKPDNSRD